MQVDQNFQLGSVSDKSIFHPIDPDTGEIIWSTEVSGGGTQGGIHFGMAAEGKTVYVPINDMKNTHDGKVWQNRKPGMHSIDAETGNILWSNIFYKTFLETMKKSFSTKHET